MTTATATPEARILEAIAETAQLFPELTLKDRCDSCGAAAKAQFQVSAELPNVLLCGHHWRKVRTNVEDSGYLYATELDDAESEPFTWASHDKPWPNQFRDAGSAAG